MAETESGEVELDRSEKCKIVATPDNDVLGCISEQIILMNPNLLPESGTGEEPLYSRNPPDKELYEEKSQIPEVLDGVVRSVKQKTKIDGLTELRVVTGPTEETSPIQSPKSEGSNSSSSLSDDESDSASFDDSALDKIKMELEQNFPPSLSDINLAEQVQVRTVRLLYNPMSGNRSGEKVMRRAKRKLEAYGITVIPTRLERRGHAEELCETMDLTGIDVVCAVGGDGTFHECVNGMMKRLYPSFKSEYRGGLRRLSIVEQEEREKLKDVIKKKKNGSGSDTESKSKTKIGRREEQKGKKTKKEKERKNQKVKDTEPAPQKSESAPRVVIKLEKEQEDKEKENEKDTKNPNPASKRRWTLPSRFKRKGIGLITDSDDTDDEENKTHSNPNGNVNDHSSGSPPVSNNSGIEEENKQNSGTTTAAATVLEGEEKKRAKNQPHVADRTNLHKTKSSKKGKRKPKKSPRRKADPTTALKDDDPLSPSPPLSSHTSTISSTSSSPLSSPLLGTIPTIVVEPHGGPSPSSSPNTSADELFEENQKQGLTSSPSSSSPSSSSHVSPPSKHSAKKVPSGLLSPDESTDDSTPRKRTHLSRGGSPKVVPLALIAAGTGNSFLHELGTYKMKMAIQHIARGVHYPLDISRLYFGDDTTCYSFNSIHWGLASKVNVTAEKLRWMGNAIRYTTAVFIQMMKGKTTLAKISVVDENDKVIEFDEQFCLAIANNIITASKGMKMAPAAKIDDGLIDLLLITTSSSLDLMHIFKKTYEGSHTELPYVRYLQVKKFSITPYKVIKDPSSDSSEIEEIEELLDVDGELKGCTPFTCEVVPRALRFIL